MALAVPACKGDKNTAENGEEPRGRVSLVLSVDWEGAFFSPEGLDAMDTVRETLPGAPLTHFVTPAYYTRAGANEAEVTRELRGGMREGDEIGLHLHGWRSLVEHAEVEPIFEPSFLGPDEPRLEIDGDHGYEVDLSAYSTDELEQIIRASRTLLEDQGFEVVPVIRIGGMMATLDVLTASRVAGFAIDSSAGDPEEAAGEPERAAFVERARGVWPEVKRLAQPFTIETPAGPVLEMPLHSGDYLETAEMEAILSEAVAQAQASEGWVFVDIVFHQETAHHFAPGVIDAVTAALRQAPDGAIVFHTKTEAASLVPQARDQAGRDQAP